MRSLDLTTLVEKMKFQPHHFHNFLDAPLFSSLLSGIKRDHMLRAVNSVSLEKMAKYVHFLAQADKWDEATFVEENRKACIDILRYAIKRVPFYRSQFENGKIPLIKIEDNFDYWQDIPVLQKKDLMFHGQDLISKDFNADALILQTTGGSTGGKATVYYDKKASLFSAAITWHIRSLMKGSWNKPEVHVAGRFIDGNRTSYFDRETAKRIAHNRTNLFISNFDEINCEKYLSQLKERNVYLIHGHPSTLYRLAIQKKISGNDLTFAVFDSSGELLSPLMAKTIRSSFECEIYNRYGLAEFGVVALSKPNALGVKTIPGSAHIEHLGLSNNDNTTAIIVTGLHNKAFPLIRYDTGDISILDESDRTFHLKGRVHDMVHLKSGAFFSHYIQDVLQHKCRGLVDFKIDVTDHSTTLKCWLEEDADPNEVVRVLRLNKLLFDKYDFLPSGEYVRATSEGQKFNRVNFVG